MGSEMCIRDRFSTEPDLSAILSVLLFDFLSGDLSEDPVLSVSVLSLLEFSDSGRWCRILFLALTKNGSPELSSFTLFRSLFSPDDDDCLSSWVPADLVLATLRS